MSSVSLFNTLFEFFVQNNPHVTHICTNNTWILLSEPEFFGATRSQAALCSL